MGLFSSIFGGSKTSGAPGTVWDQQAPFLHGLYNRAWQASLGGGIPGLGAPGGGLTGPQPGTLSGSAPGAGWMFGGANSRLPALAGAGSSWQRVPMPGAGYQDPLGLLGGNLLGQGLGMAGQLGLLGQVGNPFAQAQVGQFGQELGNIFSRNIAPTIASQFGLAGGLGGDRQALALGEAAGRLGEQFRGGALDILGDSARLALGANQAGLGSLGGLFGLGNAALFGSLPGLQSLLGAPTVLGGGSSGTSTPGILGTLISGARAYATGGWAG
jgi:hypothetical protein